MTTAPINLPEIDVIASYAYNSKAVLQHTYKESARVLENNIDGVFVECGVAGGACVGAMLSAMKHTGCVRPVHMFDSFEGIPLCGPEDACGQPGIGRPTHDINLDSSCPSPCKCPLAWVR